MLEIWDSIAFENVVAAEKLMRSLEAKINLLKQFPALGVSKPEIKAHYRQLVEGRYLIIYEWIEADELVKIIRVIHASRDIRRLF